MMFILHNGEFIEEADPVLTARDRALRGDGVFDTMLIRNGQPVFADKHFARLVTHAKTFGIEIRHENFQNDAERIIAKNAVQNGILTTTVTGGNATRGLQTPNVRVPNIIIRAVTAPPMDDIKLTAIIAQTVRKNEGSPLSRIKSLNYGDHILAKQEAENASAIDAILLNNQEHATCFTIGNLFMIKNETLYTPPLSDGCMDGIIRAKIMNSTNVTERSITRNDIETADGLYLTNSLRGIVPVTELGGKTCTPPPFPIDPNLHHG